MNLETTSKLSSRNLMVAITLLLLGGCFSGQAGNGSGASLNTPTVPPIHSNNEDSKDEDDNGEDKDKEHNTDPLICNGGKQAVLDRVIDGDTIDVKLDDGEIDRIRLIGIDTPERGESCFAEATDYLRKLLGNGRVRLIRDKSNRDRYGRLLRYVCSENGIFTEAALVREGLALPGKQLSQTTPAF